MNRNHPAGAMRPLAANARRALMIVSLGATLAACETDQKDYTGAIWSDYRQRHPISLVEKDRTLQIFVGSAQNALTPDQRADVVAFAQTWRDDGTGRFVIDRPTASRNPSAATAAVNEVRSILRATGVPDSAIRVQSYPAERYRLAVVRVNYPHLAAQAGPCGQWPDDLGPSDTSHFENIDYWNFGCATRRNLASMVENPTDLVQPRGEGQVYTARRTTVLDKYRKGESSATTYPDANKGAISDIGK